VLFRSDDFTMTYRSITCDSPLPLPLSLSLPLSLPRQEKIIKRERESYHISTEYTSQNTKEFNILMNNQTILVPPKPLFIGSSQIALKMPLDEVIAQVEETLWKKSDIDYQYMKSLFKWDIVHARGSSYCHFEISIFDENTLPPSYLLEGNRLSGDSLSFRLLFNEFKESLLASRSSHHTSSQLLTLPISVTGCSNLSPNSLSSVDSDSSLHSLLPIISMISPSSPLDIQLEGVRILCDLTMSIEYHGILVDCCLHQLILLLVQEIDFLNVESYDGDSAAYDDSQLGCYALFAIANLSTYRPCQDMLVSDQSFLSYLFRQIADGPHTTAEMRRECARTLANLCVGLASKIVRNLGIRYAEKWIETVDSLKDERLRLHATRAKLYIQKCC